MAINASTPTRVKTSSITNPTPDSDNHTLVLGQVKESIEVGQRLRGDPNDSFVRVSEINSALGTRMVNGTLQPPNSTASGSVSVSVINSIMGNGTGVSPLQLVGDSAAPGNNMVYGTNGSGVKGWYAAGGGGGSLSVTDGTHTVTGTTSLTFAGAVVSGSTPNATVTISGGSTALPGTIPDLVMWIETDNILGAAGSKINRLQERTPWITGVAAYPTVAGTPAVIDSTQLNGLNVLKWTATITAAYNMQDGIWLDIGCTYFFVGRGLNNTKTGSQSLIAGQITGTSALYLSNGTGLQNIALVNEGVATIGACSTAWVLNTFFQANVTYNATTGAWAWRQGRAAANSGVGTTGVGTNAALSTIGNDQFGSTLGGSIAALIVYNRVLTPTEITNIENYLFAKWGV